MKQNLYKLIESAIINLELITNNFKSTNSMKNVKYYILHTFGEEKMMM